MEKVMTRLAKAWMAIMVAVMCTMMVGLYTPSGARADAQDAKKILKSMSDYLAAQKKISFAYDSILEVVTTDHQKIALAASGTVTLNRPDKIIATRIGGFGNIAMFFDGKVLTLLGKNLNAYAQIKAPGTIDHLITEMRDKYNRPLPAADLLTSNAYDYLMVDVTDIKDLGSGVIGGVESDHFAFRAKEVDWQIWIARGKSPYPTRFSITSKLIVGGPQYSIQIRDWKAGDAVKATDFSFKNSTNAKKVDLKDIGELSDLPSNFTKGGAK
ncbi:DUF2092 domain-containing protein [Desulfoferula mesophila]|uniref:DUF2092 domain-containing protein n=1 Tax=Desulfoferula mesophila TaxID=3058419 RepID=A0AAU9EF52_9BACT|nr:hypothetical protein FAK_22230 [Desulfoferula mesophilus]